MKRSATTWLLCLGLTMATSARAEAPGAFAAAMGLSAADGSVRTQTSVRMSLSPVPGTDSVMAMSDPVQARLGDVRSCFAQAMTSNPRAEGRVVVQVEAVARGKAKASVTLNETGDPKLAECMRRALSRTDLRTVTSPRASVLVALDLTNPTARMREAMDRKGATAQAVQARMLGGGLVRSEGGTQGGEVRFELTTSAYARPTLERLHHDLSLRLAGLLDCRRKASRRGVQGAGAIELAVSLDRGRAARTRTLRTDLTDRNSAPCVASWLTRSVGTGVSSDGASEIALTVRFAR